MTGFLRSLSSEFYKTKNTLAFTSAILLPVILCGLLSFGFYYNAAKVIPMTGEQQWFRFVSAFMGVMGNLLVPMLVIFQTFSVNNLEHRADMWKGLFSLPISKWSIYSAKYTYAVALNAFCISLFGLLIYASGHIINLLVPEFKFNQYDISALLLDLHVTLFLSSTGILSIQFLMSLLWADFLKSMGTGLLLAVFGIITANINWKYAYTIPYAHPALAVKNMFRHVFRPGGPTEALEWMSRETYISLTVALLTFIAGFFVVSRKSIK